MAYGSLMAYMICPTSNGPYHMSQMRWAISYGFISEFPFGQYELGKVANTERIGWKFRKGTA